MKNILFGVSVLLLAACGGGGGGGGGNGGSDLLAQTAFSGSPSSSSATQQVISNVEPQQVEVITPALEQLLQASSRTSFGSVAQSLESGVSPVTGVDTTFDGTQFVLNLNRRDGTTTTLDSSRHDTLLATTYGPNTNPVTRRPAVDAAVYDLNQQYAAMAGVAVEWSNTDFTDYIAGGYWVYVDFADPSMTNALSGAELGAFIDGAAYQDRTSTPVTGTATYTGIAAGAYVSRYGTDLDVPWPRGVPFPAAWGPETTGDRVRLVADFAAGSVSGQIDNISIDGVIVTPQGALHPVAREPGYTIHLDAVGIGQDGRASGPGVRVTHPQLGITGIRVETGPAGFPGWMTMAAIREPLPGPMRAGLKRPAARKRCLRARTTGPLKGLTEALPGKGVAQGKACTKSHFFCKAGLC